MALSSLQFLSIDTCPGDRRACYFVGRREGCRCFKVLHIRISGMSNAIEVIHVPPAAMSGAIMSVFMFTFPRHIRRILRQAGKGITASVESISHLWSLGRVVRVSVVVHIQIPPPLVKTDRHRVSSGMLAPRDVRAVKGICRGLCVGPSQ
jgi:hypothetical protein